MDFQAPSLQPSFIPKRNTSENNQPESSPVGIFMFIGVVIFLISLITYGGVLFYTSSVEAGIKKGQVDLDKNRAQFGQFGVDQLNEITRFDLKLKTAQQLLNSHVSLLNIYNDLEALTYQTIRFKTFKYGLSDDGKISLKMSGEARSYTAINDYTKNNYIPVALQSSKLSGVTNIKDVLFSDLNLDQSGNVVFNYSSTLDPKFISYREVRLLK